jgi:hypothetical protein
MEPSPAEWIVFYWIVGTALLLLVGVCFVAMIKAVKAVVEEIGFRKERRYHRQQLESERM